MRLAAGRSTVVVAALVAAWLIPSVCFAGRIEADERIQGLLKKMKMEAAPEERAAALRQICESDPLVLVPQLVYFRATESQAGPEAAGITGMLVRKMEISKGQIASALTPYLDEKSDELQHEIREALAYVEDGSATRPPDFSRYEARIEANARDDQALPLYLIHHMYQRDIGHGFQAVVRAVYQEPEEGKPLMWAEHVIADTTWKHRHGFLDRTQVEPEAMRELETLAGHPQWWVRLYVAELIRQVPAFRSDDLIEQLKDDEHELVRQAMTETASSKKERR